MQFYANNSYNFNCTTRSHDSYANVFIASRSCHKRCNSASTRGTALTAIRKFASTYAACTTARSAVVCNFVAAICNSTSMCACRGCGPKTHRRSCSTRSCRLSHSFWRLSKMLRQIFNKSSTTCKLPYKIHTTTGNIRSHRQVGNARLCTHTRCNTRLLTQRRNFPKACESQNDPSGTH